MSEIITHKTDAMRRILFLVSHGYTHYTCGTVTLKKVEALYEKYAERYRIKRNAEQRRYDKDKGIARCKLVLWTESPDTVCWWLLATEGEGLITQLETLMDASRKSQRLTHTGYELVQTPRKGREASWSWRITSEQYQTWEERLRLAIRHRNDDAMKQAMYSLKRVPAFAESRRQAFALAKLAEAEWKRTRSEEWPHGKLYVGWYGKFQTAEKIPIKDIGIKKKKVVQTKTKE